MYLIVQDAATKAITLVAGGHWEPLNYGDKPISDADIQVLLKLPLCINPTNSKGQKAIIPATSPRMALLKQKVAGIK